MTRSWIVALAAPLIVATACAHGGPAAGGTLTLRPACGVDQRWTGTACEARAGIDDLEVGARALAAFDVDTAVPAFDRAARHPLDLDRNITLWEQLGIAQAYVEHDREASAAFDRLLALDPDHSLRCTLSTRATWLFQEARNAAATRSVPNLELRWRRDLRLGAPVPLEIETVAAAGGLLRHATIYVRTRGESAWQAADLTLPPTGAIERARLPAVLGTKPTSLEIYAVGTDDAGNETFRWASPTRPREIPLRYEPPSPWYRTWWVWAAAGGVVAVGTGIGVYAAVWAPGPVVGGGISVE